MTENVKAKVLCGVRRSGMAVDEQRHPRETMVSLGDVGLLAFAGGELIFLRDGGGYLSTSIPAMWRGGMP